jgi:hypothetical protein
MKQPLRDRVVSSVIAVLVLGGVAACSTAALQPAASPQASSSDADHCVRNGGLWRSDVCEMAGGGGGY